MSDLPVLNLGRLVDTWWCYRYNLICKINLRFLEIVEVLHILAENDEQKVRALGILREMTIIKISYAMETLLKIIHCALKELQGTSIILPVALDLIKSNKKQLQNMRNDEFWIKILGKAETITLKIGVVKHKKKNPYK